METTRTTGKNNFERGARANSPALFLPSSTGFGTLHNLLGMILDETKEVPDQAEKGVPEDNDLIIADYAKDTKAQLGMAE